MPGANAKVQKIVSRLKRLTDIGREIELEKIADTYGAGFADAIRRQITPAQKASQ